MNFEDSIRTWQKKSVEFDGFLANVKNLNSELAERSDKLLLAITELVGNVSADTTKLCAVCYTRERTHVLGCGHVLCGSCCDRAKRRNPPRCFTCRQPIEQIIRIYL